MKVGIVLEGGAMRGMYTAGVLDVFLKHGIIADGVIGVSAGAAFGVNYPSKQSGRVIRYNKRFNSDKNYMGIRPLLREGNIVSTEYAYNVVPRTLDIFDDEAFKKSGVPFYAVVTNINNGSAEYIKIDSVLDRMDVLRASGSMPFLSKPVELDGGYYLDGAVADSIPFKHMSEMGYGKMIVVLTRDRGYRKKPIPRIFANAVYRKYPEFKKRVAERHLMYNSSVDELNEWEASGKALVIRPSEPIKIGRIEKNPERLQAVYDLGTLDAESRLGEIKSYISDI